jgi:CheY-like chemotaxis protein
MARRAVSPAKPQNFPLTTAKCNEDLHVRKFVENDPTILLVDDSDNDLLLMSLAFEKASFPGVLRIVHDGEEAIAYLEGRHPYSDRVRDPLPTLVLLDLNMPKKSGFDVLEWVRAHPTLRRLPIMVLTASMVSGDVERAFDLGANSFLVKPTRIEDLIVMIRSLREWLNFNHFPRLAEVPQEELLITATS